MKSVKPGRGPSLLGGAASAIAAVIGVVWIAVAASMDAPVYFCLFGVVFVVLAIAHALYDLYNATAKRRFSLFDVTEEGEEPDPRAAADGADDFIIAEAADAPGLTPDSPAVELMQGQQNVTQPPTSAPAETKRGPAQTRLTR